MLKEIILIIHTSNQLLIFLIQINGTVDYFLGRKNPESPPQAENTLYLVIEHLLHYLIIMFTSAASLQCEEGNQCRKHSSHVLNACSSPTHTHTHTRWSNICLPFPCVPLDNTRTQQIFQNMTVLPENSPKDHSQMTTYSWTKKKKGNTSTIWKNMPHRDGRKIKIRTVKVNHRLNLIMCITSQMRPW